VEDKEWPEMPSIYETFQKGIPEEAKAIDRIMTGMAVGNEDYVTIYPNPGNEKFEGSPYYLKENDRPIYHFTSLNNALSILNEGFLRMYTLNHANDPQEILFALHPRFENVRGKLKEDDQQHVYSASFCEEQKIMDLDMWRFYGDNGKGVALEFHITNEPRKWEEYHLGKVSYGKENREALNAYLRYLNDFEHHDKIFPRLHPVLAFHKSVIFRSEAEIRLLQYTAAKPEPRNKPHGEWFRNSHNISLPIVKASLTKRLELGSYTMLPIQNFFPKTHYFYELGPSLTLAGIVLGLSYTEEDVKKIQTLVDRSYYDHSALMQSQFKWTFGDHVPFEIPRVKLSSLAGMYRG
jgi:hypothetical protein